MRNRPDTEPRRGNSHVGRRWWSVPGPVWHDRHRIQVDPVGRGVDPLPAIRENSVEDADALSSRIAVHALPGSRSTLVVRLLSPVLRVRRGLAGHASLVVKDGT